MTKSLSYNNFSNSNSNTQTVNSPLKWIRWLVNKIAIATLILMAIGAATRVMNAGLACPDWPLCYGQMIPTQQMNLQVFLEWFHRLDASLIGLSTIVLVGLSWWFKSQLPKWLPMASTFALCLIVFQGVLGGLTVTQLLRFDIVTAHLGTALLFFGTLVTIASFLTPVRVDAPSNNETDYKKITIISTIATVFVYLQCLLGGLVGSQWAAHQCFTGNQLCGVMNSHIIGVFPATITTIVLLVMTWRSGDITPQLKTIAKYIALILVGQISLGIATFYLHLQVEPLTIAHHTMGAGLFASLIYFSIISYKSKSSIVKT